MNLQLVTVALDPETGAFPAQPLRQIKGEILSVVEHFFHHAGLPHLLLVVHHRPPAESSGRRSAESRPPKEDPAKRLGPDDLQLYEALRTWRLSRAEADGVPVYVILNNEQLAQIAETRPLGVGALRQLRGIGEGKAGHGC